MAATEQLNIRLAPSERRRLAAAAKRSDRSVSEYVRDRLLGESLTQADMALLTGLASMHTSIQRTLQRIDNNLADIARLKTEYDEPLPTNKVDRLTAGELDAIAQRLAL